MADEEKETQETPEEKPKFGFTILGIGGGYRLNFLGGDLVEKEPSIDETIVAMKTILLNLETDWVAFKLVNTLKRIQTEELINKSVKDTLKKGSIN